MTDAEWDALKSRLARSAFRSRFRLTGKDLVYAQQRGASVLRQHARDLLRERLAPAAPRNDGRQTPWRGHPVFVAQHATATCCRSCLQTWHGIAKGRPLSEEELDRAVDLVLRWIAERLSGAALVATRPGRYKVESASA